MSSLFTIAAFLKLCLASAVLGLNCLYGWEIWFIQRECGYIRVQIFDVENDASLLNNIVIIGDY